MSDPIDVIIAAIAARQHGNVTRRQLLDLGLGRSAIAYRLQTGRLHRIFAGVYAVGHCPPSPLARGAAAVLACGDGAVLSHGSAATLWGIDARWHQPLEVTARSEHTHAGIVIHRSKTLTDEDLTANFGIAVTSPARTVFDLAPRLSDRKLARAVNQARLNGYLAVDALARLRHRFPRHKATKRLTSLLVDAYPTRSEFEDAFLAFTERYNLPRPETNVRVNRHLVDALFRDHELIVELDGYEFHKDRPTFESDRDRDADHLAHNLGTVRITWERMTEKPDREAARLQAILDARTRKSA